MTTSEKKIVHLANFQTNKANGAYKVIECLAQSLNSNGVPCEIWGLSTDKDVNDLGYYRHFPCKIKSFKVTRDLLRQLRAEKNKIAVVNLHSVFLPVNVTLAVALKLMGIPTALTPHGGYHDFVYHRNAFQKKVFISLFERVLLRTCGFFLVHGDPEMRFIQKYAKGRCHLITNGVNALPPATASKKFIKEGMLQMLFLGRMDYYHKGIDLLLEAIGISKHKSKVMLNLTGPVSDSHRSFLEALIEKYGLQEHVSLNPPVYTEAEKEALFRKADIFVHTSRWEGVPNAVLEAMANGLPVLITRNTDLDNLVARFDAGYISDGLAPADIARQLDRIFSDPQALEVKAQGARAMIAADCLWEKVARQYHLIVNKELGQK